MPELPSMQQTPPAIPGCTYIKPLGSGSTATVYQYLQHNPERIVAVKVSNSSLTAAERATFAREADIMGPLSSHPYILSMYGSGTISGGLAYLTTEYAPGGSYKDVMRRQTLTAAQTADLGVKLSGALYTAHMQGVVHHDIKPANVLISEHGQPLLSDFGISTTAYEADTDTGFSVPWAPPEAFSRTHTTDELSDIYSLAASLFGLLTGHSPFEYGYHPRNRAELADFIMHRDLLDIDDPEVPHSLERVLRRAMSRNPADRYTSALKLGRALQQVQQEAYGSVTPLVAHGVEEYPAGMSGANTPRVSSAKTMTATPLNPKSEGHIHIKESQRQAAINGKAIAIICAGIAAVAAIVAVFAFVVAPHMDSSNAGEHATGSSAAVQGQGKAPDSDTDQHRPDKTDTDSSSVDGGEAVPVVTNLIGVYSDNGASVTFTWKNPTPKQGDTYAWTLVDSGNTEPQGSSQTMPATTRVNTPTVTIDAAQNEQTCIQVSLVRSDGKMSSMPATACAVQH